MERLFSAVTAVVLVAACGSDITQPPHDATSLAPVSAELAAGVEREAAGFYTMRVDSRRCAFPLCGGYWVSAVNSAAKTVPTAHAKPSAMSQRSIGMP